MTKNASYSRIAISIRYGHYGQNRGLEPTDSVGEVKWNDIIDKTGPLDWE